MLYVCDSSPLGIMKTLWITKGVTPEVFTGSLSSTGRIPVPWWSLLSLRKTELLVYLNRLSPKKVSFASETSLQKSYTKYFFKRTHHQGEEGGGWTGSRTVKNSYGKFCLWSLTIFFPIFLSLHFWLVLTFSHEIISHKFWSCKSPAASSPNHSIPFFFFLPETTKLSSAITRCDLLFSWHITRFFQLWISEWVNSRFSPNWYHCFDFLSHLKSFNILHEVYVKHLKSRVLINLKSGIFYSCVTTRKLLSNLIFVKLTLFTLLHLKLCITVPCITESNISQKSWFIFPAQAWFSKVCFGNPRLVCIRGAFLSPPLSKNHTN